MILLVTGLATHVLLHQSKHGEVQTDRERCEGLGAVPPRDHRVDEICLLQRQIRVIKVYFWFKFSYLGLNIHSRLLLQERGQLHDDVHVRVGDRRAGVQQGAQRPGDDRYHWLQVSNSTHDTLLDPFRRSFMDGNILSWEREKWNLTSPYNRSQMEILDFDRDVCSQPKVW